MESFTSHHNPRVAALTVVKDKDKRKSIETGRRMESWMERRCQSGSQMDIVRVQQWQWQWSMGVGCSGSYSEEPCCSASIGATYLVQTSNQVNQPTVLFLTWVLHYMTFFWYLRKSWHFPSDVLSPYSISSHRQISLLLWSLIIITVDLSPWCNLFHIW